MYFANDECHCNLFGNKDPRTTFPNSTHVVDMIEDLHV